MIFIIVDTLDRYNQNKREKRLERKKYTILELSKLTIHSPVLDTNKKKKKT